MADDPLRSGYHIDDTEHDPAGSGPAMPNKMPAWVKVSLIILAILVLALVVANLMNIGGSHGPGRHLPRGSSPLSQYAPQ